MAALTWWGHAFFSLQTDSGLRLANTNRLVIPPKSLPAETEVVVIEYDQEVP